MIRKSTLSLSNTNDIKLSILDDIINESKRIINLYIDELWLMQDFNSKYISTKQNTWFSARMQQNLGKQALQIVKSQRKRKKKHKPIFNSNTIEFDPRFIDFQKGNHFDLFIRLTSIGNKISLKLPVNQHRHFNIFNSNNWNLKKSIRLRKVGEKYFIDCYFNKEKSELKTEGRLKSIDVGYKKLIVSSDKEFIGDNKIYEKIAKKKQGSKAFKRALIERDEIINTSCKQLDLSDVKKLVVEDLKNVKRSTKGKIHKKFTNKLQRWSYPKVLNKLSMICDESGIKMIKVNPAFTSQTCSSCGFVDKNSRKGEDFKCTKCKYSEDADYNASLNILHIGEYGLYA